MQSVAQKMKKTDSIRYPYVDAVVFLFARPAARTGQEHFVHNMHNT